MTYKATARSPHYGRIFAYDEKGQEIKEIDILKVKVVSQNKEYVIGDLLKRVIDLDARLPLIEEFAAQNGPVISNLTEKNRHNGPVSGHIKCASRSTKIRGEIMNKFFSSISNVWGYFLGHHSAKLGRKRFQ